MSAIKNQTKLELLVTTVIGLIISNYILRDIVMPEYIQHVLWLFVVIYFVIRVFVIAEFVITQKYTVPPTSEVPTEAQMVALMKSLVQILTAQKIDKQPGPSTP